MNRTRNLLLGCFITGCGIACTQKPAPVADTKAISKQATDVLHRYAADINRNGLKNAAAYFADDPQFYWVEDGVVQYPDRASLIKGIAAFAPMVDTVRMSLLETRTTVLDKEHALVFAAYKEDIRLKSGYTIHLDGAMTILMEKKTEGWKFLNGHSSVKKPRNNTN